MTIYFTDSKDKTWTVDLDIPAARRVRKMTGFDLVGRDVGVIGEAIDHPIDGVEILYALVEPDAKEEEIALDAFFDRMCVDLEPIASDLIVEVRDFFHDRGQTRMVAGWNKIIGMMKSTHGNSSTDSPESPE